MACTARFATPHVPPHPHDTGYALCRDVHKTAIGVSGAIEEAYDILARRHSAASELAEVGSGDDLIASVTRQSTAMVKHYT